MFHIAAKKLISLGVSKKNIFTVGSLGCENINEMHKKAEFVEITSAGIRESHVHDVQITKEAPNYHVE